jgi:hypothetical protein
MELPAQNPNDRSITYAPPGPTIARAFASPAFVRGVMGPLGSGKSTFCVLEILRRAAAQAPSPDGIRRSRWAIIRNSYPELRTTTLKTWLDWCPQAYGRLTMDSPITHRIQQSNMDIEILFLALDRVEDQRKLLSLELTGAWINEAREVPKAILDALTGRVGRYPSRLQGGCSWSGILLDTNPPDDQSWWYKMAEEETPAGWEFFQQPAGDSPQAENLANLPVGYYDRIKSGKDPDWVKVYVQGQYGFVTEGKPVYPMYRDSIHCATSRIQPVEDIPLLMAADFGLTPAAVFGQKLANGRWLILDELVSTDCGIVRFAELLKVYVAEHYGAELDIGGAWGDPAGNQRSTSDERTALEIMTTITGWKWKPAPTNEFLTRREVVVHGLSRLVDGAPGLELSPNCHVLRKGFASGYHFKAIQSGNGAQFHEMPAKNAASHPHDALQYLLLGAGEYISIIKKKRGPQSVKVRVAKDMDYNIFG